MWHEDGSKRCDETGKTEDRREKVLDKIEEFVHYGERHGEFAHMEMGREYL